MSKHVIDHAPTSEAHARVLRYLRAGSVPEFSEVARKMSRLHRQPRAPRQSTARMMAYLRIERGYRA